MIQSIKDEDEESFLRHCAERAWDRAQLAQIAEIERTLVDYAMTAWRSMSITPPEDVLLLCSTNEGVMLLRKNQMGDWRSAGGVPQRPPHAWMPCPAPEPR